MELRELGILLWGEVLLERSLAKGRQAEIPTIRDDPNIGRWLSINPLAGKYPLWPSYNYVNNRPINDIDFKGLYKFSSEIKSNPKLLLVFKMVKYFSNHEQKVKNAFADLNTKVSDFTEDDNGPSVSLQTYEYIGGYYPGWENPDYSTDEIIINKQLVEKLNSAETQEERDYRTGVLIVTTLHETGHWAWLT